MQTLEEKIMAKIKEAMRAKDKERLEALRAVKSAILLEKTKGNTGGLSEADEMKLLQKLVKQRYDSAEIFQQQKRDDLAQTEIAQAKIIEAFLPEPMSKEEIETAINQIIADVGATSMKDMGKVMGLATQQMAGKADGKLISSIVKEKLS